MNSIFFFIPFLIIASAGLLHDAYSFEVETGYNYFKIRNGDGTSVFQTHHPYVLENGEYVPYVQNGLTVSSHIGTVSLDGSGKYTWNDKFDDYIIAKYSDVTDQINWTYPNALNSDTPDNSFADDIFTSTKSAAGIGELKYKYVFDQGRWKTQLEATNLSSLNTKVFGFDQIIDLKSDTVKFGGVTRNLDNFDGVTFDKEFLDNNKAKVINLLNGINFDFDLGYENLYSVTVYDTGINSSQLVFDYRTDTVLLPNETLIIDPAFTSATPSDEGRSVSATGAGTSCPAAFSSGDANVNLYKGQDAAGEFCTVPFFEWDISSFDGTETILSATIEYDVTAATNAIDCSWKLPSSNPTPGQTQYDDGLSGTVIIDGSSECTTVADGHTESFNSVGVTQLQTAVDASQAWFGVVGSFDSWTRDASFHTITFRTSDAILTIYYDTTTPDAVDDLTSPAQSFGSVDLLWSEPNLKSLACQGYQINYTTPYGNPTTVITNNTETCTTSTTVTGLAINTPYTFGVSVWTSGGNNATHPPMTWLNVTTPGNFTIGGAAFNQTNSQVLPITFEEQAINSTAKFLNVTFSNSFDPIYCDFGYKFANTNQTYGINDDSYAVSTTLNETAFTIVNATNEIIDVYCWDDTTGIDGRYLLVQTDFPLLQQIADFRSGTYGTEGMFGVYDFVTLLVVIISMIGMNRVNESVGAIFNVALLGGLAYFGIIELPTVIFGALTIVIVMVITSTRKGG